MLLYIALIIWDYIALTCGLTLQYDVERIWEEVLVAFSRIHHKNIQQSNEALVEIVKKLPWAEVPRISPGGCRRFLSASLG